MKSSDEEEDDEIKGLLPPLIVKSGSSTRFNHCKPSALTHHPARYTEASLVKKTRRTWYWSSIYVCANYFHCAE